MQNDDTQPKRRRNRSRKTGASLSQVAEKAGVSTATVSRAFNDPERVSETVRTRIFAAAELLNWVPSAAGRALATNRTRILGAIIPTLDNEIFARQVLGMQDVLTQHGYRLFLGCSRYSGEDALAEVGAMLQHGVEGLMLVGEDYPDMLFQQLKVHKTPYVLSYIYGSDLPHPCIGFRHDEIFAALTRVHLDAGHQKFGLIFQQVEGNTRVAARLEGVKLALSEAGIALDPDRILIGDGSLKHGADSLDALMRLPLTERPTAIICGNDTQAIGALSRARELGLKVPEDFSISGFDNTAMSEMTSPPLSTAEIDNYVIGVEAAHQILQRLKLNDLSISHSLVEPRLVLRQSIAAPPRHSDPEHMISA
ncbi:LacI family DNA-binding transcriptional regulator [Celeribacter sp.]|uniref:LacI family DNA-binding transcriptional regulator n=1 Tax=Celeribacter sp. TaxID=1890673 RepID=UPI003A937E68